MNEKIITENIHTHVRSQEVEFRRPYAPPGDETNEAMHERADPKEDELIEKQIQRELLELGYDKERVPRIASKLKHDRWQIPNKRYITRVLAPWYFRAIGRTMRRETQKNPENRSFLPEQCGRVVFDLNGLKATNDTVGHASGDELLEETVRIFTSGATGVSMKQEGWKVYPIMEGADEFSVFLAAPQDKTLGEAELNDIGERYRSEVRSINSRKWFGAERARQKIFESIKKSRPELLEISEGKAPSLPDDFTYQIDIAYGGVTFHEVLNAIENEREKLLQQGYKTVEIQNEFKEYLGLTIAHLFFYSEERMMEHKKQIKEKLEQEDPISHFISMRTEEQRRTEKMLTMQKKLTHAIAQVFAGQVIDQRHIMIPMEEKNI